jgi:hypothetical protein
MSSKAELGAMRGIIIDSTLICNDLISIICKYADSRKVCFACFELCDNIDRSLYCRKCTHYIYCRTGKSTL